MLPINSLKDCTCSHRGEENERRGREGDSLTSLIKDWEAAWTAC
jgi:hypothetical protein